MNCFLLPVGLSGMAYSIRKHGDTVAAVKLTRGSMRLPRDKEDKFEDSIMGDIIDILQNHGSHMIDLYQLELRSHKNIPTNGNFGLNTSMKRPNIWNAFTCNSSFIRDKKSIYI